MRLSRRFTKGVINDRNGFTFVAQKAMFVKGRIETNTAWPEIYRPILDGNR
jgi:hypothetical protein